VTYGFKILK